MWPSPSKRNVGQRAAGTGSPVRRGRTCRLRSAGSVPSTSQSTRSISARSGAKGPRNIGCREARRTLRTCRALRPCKACARGVGLAVGAQALPEHAAPRAARGRRAPAPVSSAACSDRRRRTCVIGAHQVGAQRAADGEHEQEGGGDLGAHVVGHDGLEGGVLRTGADADDAGVERRERQRHPRIRHQRERHGERNVRERCPQHHALVGIHDAALGEALGQPAAKQQAGGREYQQRPALVDAEVAGSPAMRALVEGRHPERIAHQRHAVDAEADVHRQEGAPVVPQILERLPCRRRHPTVAGVALRHAARGVSPRAP